MITIQNLFQQAQLAEAAYANLIDNAGNLITDNAGVIAALTDSKFSQSQATVFVTQWRVVDQYTASGGLLGSGSGFSGTLFQNITTGQYQFSLRGTQPGATDLSADIGDILADGVALDQIVDMYNYWQSLTHTGVYQAAKLETNLLETAALNLLLPGLVRDAYIATLRLGGAIIDVGLLGTQAQVRYITTNNNSTQLSDPGLQIGSGKLAATATVNVDGHSLGGHLAMAFSRLFPSATTSVTAVNGAGFNYANSNVNTLFTALNGAPGFDAGKITNIVGSAAMSLVSQDWLLLQQPAGRTEIYTESAGFGTLFGHGSSQMTDSLALYNLLAKLDPSLNTALDGLARITAVLKASANVANRSLENTLDTLRTLFEQNYAGSNSNLTAAATATDNREAYYANLNTLNGYLSSTFVTPAFTLISLTGLSAAALQSAAQSDIAVRYALLRLNAFALGGATLYGAINTDHSLDLYDSTTRQGSLTTDYLTDRAHMLAHLIERNLADSITVPATSAHATDKEYFFDAASNTRLSTPAAFNGRVRAAKNDALYCQAA